MVALKVIETEKPRRRFRYQAASSAVRPSRPARQGSWLVRSLKIVLPALAIALTVLLFAWPELMQDAKTFRIGLLDNPGPQSGAMMMVNPRFSGVDGKNQPYTVTAETARQFADNEDLFHLELPKADITLNSGTWVALNADMGRYNSHDGVLDLEGTVSLFQDEGFEVVTEQARLNLETGIAEGDSPVRAQGPSGTLSSEGFRILDRGKRVIFKGRSHLFALPSAKNQLP